MKQSLYDLVGVPPEAPREMVAAACRRRIAQLEREATDEAKAGIYAVREAWSILGDDKLRAGYDASLAAAKDAPAPGRRPATEAELASASFATELLKPRHVLAENWERYRKLVFVLLFVGFLALSAAWNESRRKAIQQRLDDANYEAEYGKTREEAAREAAQAAKAEAPAKAAEPFSAEKFEQELKAREAAIQDQVAREQTAKEDEFREKLQQENDPRASRRRSRYR